MDAPVTDPTLAAYHAPLSEHERVLFFSYHDDDTGDVRLAKVVRPAATAPAPLLVEPLPDTSEQGDG